jgi:hypothetical protein
MKTSHIATSIFLIFCFSSIHSLLVEKLSRCKAKGSVPIAQPIPTPPAKPTDIDGDCKPNVEGLTEGIRYVRLKGTKENSNYLQISQVVVLDKDGKNVAVKKPAFSSSKDPGSAFQGVQVDPNWAVDGLINNRCGWPADKVVIVNYYPADKDPWWMVDLGSEFSIKQVKYYNRSCWGFRAKGVEVELLDSDKNIVKRYRTVNEKLIYCINTI